MGRDDTREFSPSAPIECLIGTLGRTARAKPAAATMHRHRPIIKMGGMPADPFLAAAALFRSAGRRTAGDRVADEPVGRKSYVGNLQPQSSRASS
jgi:hypothetical protein